MTEPTEKPSEPSQPALHFQPEWCRVTLASIGDAVMTTDNMGRITFLNSVAESLTGWAQQDAEGVPLETIFKIVNEDTRNTVESPTIRALRDGVIVGLANHTLLIAKDGTERPIDDSAAPIRNEKGEVAGVVLTRLRLRPTSRVWGLVNTKGSGRSARSACAASMIEPLKGGSDPDGIGVDRSQS